MNKFQIGDRVRVISSTCTAHDYLGVVQDYNYDNEISNKYVDVLLDGYEHTITYRESSLKLINGTINNKGDNIMLGNFKVAGVKFLIGCNTNKEYDFALYDENIFIGDIVVCDTINGLTLGKITSISNKDDKPNNKASKEIVCKVDMTDFNNRKEKKIRMKELKNKMDAQVKKLQESAVYEMLADKDDELKSMLQEYKLLKNSNANDIVF
jgi:hypothetical protein